MASDITDGNTSQWDKLKAMRARRDGAETPPATPPPSTEQPRNADGTFATTKEPPAPPAETPPPAATTPPVETPPPAAPPVETPPPAAATPPTTPPVETPPPADTRPTTVEIEIDGQKVAVDPSLADAFKKAESITKDAAKDADREKLKAELREELKQELTPPAPTAADKAADDAIKSAEEIAKLKPDTKLLLTDPEEWQRQQDVYEEAKTKAAVAASKRETLAEVERRQATQRATAEEQARGILREQFFQAYPVLRDSSDIVVPLLKAKLDEVIASGKLNKPMPPEESIAFKNECFAAVAAQATRRVVSLMNAGKKVAPPPPPPPTVVTSAPAKPAPPAPPKEPEKPREKYPKGSVSAALAERRASRERGAA